VSEVKVLHGFDVGTEPLAELGEVYLRVAAFEANVHQHAEGVEVGFLVLSILLKGG
jgi:hypothetical protein